MIKFQDFWPAFQWNLSLPTLQCLLCHRINLISQLTAKSRRLLRLYHGHISSGAKSREHWSCTSSQSSHSDIAFLCDSWKYIYSFILKVTVGPEYFGTCRETAISSHQKLITNLFLFLSVDFVLQIWKLSVIHKSYSKIISVSSEYLFHYGNECGWSKERICKYCKWKSKSWMYYHQNQAD